MWVRLTRTDDGLLTVECRPRRETGIRPVTRYGLTPVEAVALVQVEADAEKAVRDAIASIERPERPR